MFFTHLHMFEEHSMYITFTTHLHTSASEWVSMRVYIGAWHDYDRREGQIERVDVCEYREEVFEQKHVHACVCACLHVCVCV